MEGPPCGVAADQFGTRPALSMKQAVKSVRMQTTLQSLTVVLTVSVSHASSLAIQGAHVPEGPQLVTMCRETK